MRSSANRVALLAGILSFAALAFSPPAQAQTDLAIGPRGGLQISPDAFFFGAHVQFWDLIAQNVVFEPSVEIGFGEEELGVLSLDYTSYKINGNAAYAFPVGDGDLQAGPLAGLAIYRISFNDCDLPECDSTEFGLNLGGTFDFYGFGVDAYLGIGDVPDFTVNGKYTFRL